MIDKIESVVLGALKELNEELEIEVLDSPTPDTKLFGGSGVWLSIRKSAVSVIPYRNASCDECALSVVAECEKSK